MQNLIAKGAGVVVAVALFVGVAVPAANALTSSELVELLISIGVIPSENADAARDALGSTGGSTGSSYDFTRDLTIGSTGSDVVALQDLLIENGYLTIPAGVSKGYFGSLTQSALADMQAAEGITPPAGYFGPITRSAVAGMMTSDDSDDSSDDSSDDMDMDDDSDDSSSSYLRGGAGDIDSVEFISRYNNEEVGEDEEDVIVAGWEIEAADGSDIALRAVTLDFDKTSNGSGSDDDFEDYAEEVSVWFNGDEVARIDSREFDDDNDYRKSVTLDSGVVIDEEDTGDLVVAVSGIRNIDSANEKEVWNVSLNSIRFEDAQGAVITYDDGSDMGTSDDNNSTSNSDEREFSFESFSSAADIELNVTDGDDSINNSRLIQVDDNRDTDNVEIFSFEFEAEGNSDVEIIDLPIYLTTNSSADLNKMISSAELSIDRDYVGSENISIDNATGTVLFDDVDYVIDAGDTVEVVLTVDFNETSGTGSVNFNEGDTIEARFGSTEYDSDSDFDAEDEKGDDLVEADGEITGSASSEEHTLSLSDVAISNYKWEVSDTGTFLDFFFTVEVDDQDFVVDESSIASTTDGSATTSAGLLSVSGDSDDVTGSNPTFTVEESGSAIFRVRYTIGDSGSTNGDWAEVTISEVAGLKVPGSDQQSPTAVYDISS